MAGSLMADYLLDLDLSKDPSLPQIVNVRVGDKATCKIVATVTNGGTPFPLSGFTARFECVKGDKTMVRDTNCTVSGNTITYTLTEAAATREETIKGAYFAILRGSNVVDSTENSMLRILGNAESGSSGILASYYSEIDGVLAQLEAQKLAYAQAESSRVSTFNAAQTSRATTFAASEQARATTFASNESDRQTQFASLKTESESATTAANLSAATANEAAERADSYIRGDVYPDNLTTETKDYIKAMATTGAEPATEAEMREAIRELVPHFEGNRDSGLATDDEMREAIRDMMKGR